MQGFVDCVQCVDCGNCTFQWSPANLLDDPSLEFPTITNINPGDYIQFTVEVTDPYGCTQTEEVNVWHLGSIYMNTSYSGLADEDCMGNDYAYCNYWIRVDLQFQSPINSSLFEVIATNINTNQVNNLTMSGPNGLNFYSGSFNVEKDQAGLYQFEINYLFDEEPFLVGDCHNSYQYNIQIDDTYHDDFPNLFFPNAYDVHAPDPDDREFVVVAPVNIGYKAYWYKLSIFAENGGTLYIKEECADPNVPFAFNHIRWDGTIRECLTNLFGESQCYQEGVGNQASPINCNEFNDGQDICYDEDGEPRYWPIDVYTYVLELKNCDTYKVYSGDVTRVN